MDPMLRGRDNTKSLNKAIEKIVDINGHCDGRVVSRYMEVYKTKMQMRDILVSLDLETNLISLDFYRKGQWPINTRCGWKIGAETRAIEELHRACPNVKVRIGDIDLNQHFFV